MWPFKRETVIPKTERKHDKDISIPDTEAAIRFAMRQNYDNDMNCFNEPFKIIPLPREAGYGTGFEGHINITYKELKAIFGKASHGGGDGKTRKEWCFSILGVVCTIYDWKTGRRPLKRITRWNVGGSSNLSFHLVRMVIMEHRLKHGFYKYVDTP